MAVTQTTQKSIDAAVEAALKGYKERVVAEIQHYSSDGSLCEEERNRLRNVLDLGELLPASANFLLEFRGDFTIETDFNYAGAPYYEKNGFNGGIAEGILDLVKELLVDGVNLTVKGKDVKIKLTDPDSWEVDGASFDVG